MRGVFLLSCCLVVLFAFVWAANATSSNVEEENDKVMRELYNVTSSDELIAKIQDLSAKIMMTTQTRSWFEYLSGGFSEFPEALREIGPHLRLFQDLYTLSYQEEEGIDKTVLKRHGLQLVQKGQEKNDVFKPVVHIYYSTKLDTHFGLVRGSFSRKDWMTNAHVSSMPLFKSDKSKVHNGMMKAAHHVFKVVEGYMNETQSHHQRFWMVGHSMGGCAGTLASLMLRSYDYKDIRALILGAPACVAGEKLKELLSEFTFHIIYEWDIVPYCSGHALDRLWNKSHVKEYCPPGKIFHVLGGRVFLRECEFFENMRLTWKSIQDHRSYPLAFEVLHSLWLKLFANLWLR